MRSRGGRRKHSERNGDSRRRGTPPPSAPVFVHAPADDQGLPRATLARQPGRVRKPQSATGEKTAFFRCTGAHSGSPHAIPSLRSLRMAACFAGAALAGRVAPLAAAAPARRSSFVAAAPVAPRRTTQRSASTPAAAPRRALRGARTFAIQFLKDLMGRCAARHATKKPLKACGCASVHGAPPLACRARRLRDARSSCIMLWLAPRARVRAARSPLAPAARNTASDAFWTRRLPSPPQRRAQA